MAGDIRIVGISARLVADRSLAALWRASVSDAPSFTSASDTTLGELTRAALVDAGLEDSNPPVHVCASCRVPTMPEVEVAELPLAVALARASTSIEQGAAHAVAVGLVLQGTDAVISGVALVLAGSTHRGRTLAILRGLCHGHVTSEPRELQLQAALQRACSQAHIDLSSITLLDLDGDVGHLATTLRGLTPVLAGDGTPLPRCSLALRHDAAAAPAVESGMLAIVRSILAVAQCLLPPTRAEAELDEFAWLSGAERVRPWMRGPGGVPRRACCYAGTARAHACLVLEQPADAVPMRLAGARSAEVLLFGAATREQLRSELVEVAALLEHDAPDLESLAARLAARARVEGRCHRAAVVGRSVAELAHKLERLAAQLASGEQTLVRTRTGSYYADLEAHPPGRTAFCYPGQGSQDLRMASGLCIELPALQQWFDRLADTSSPSEPCPPSILVAPPSIGLSPAQQRLIGQALYDMESGTHTATVCSLALTELLGSIGIMPDAAVGYSNGENSALIVTGIFDIRSPEQLFTMMARMRTEAREADALGHFPKGRLLAVNRTPREQIEAVLAREPDLYLALDNCPAQVVLFSDEATITRVRGELDGKGAVCLTLPFDRAYHTPLFRRKAGHIRRIYDLFRIRASRIPLYSCVSTRPFPSEPDAIRDLAAELWATTVEFRRTVESMYADGIRQFVEVGAGAQLTSFVSNTLGDKPHLAVSCSIEGQGEYEHLLKGLAQLFVCGLDIDFGKLRDGVGTSLPLASDVLPPQVTTPDHEPAKLVSAAPERRVSEVLPARAPAARSSSAVAASPRSNRSVGDGWRRWPMLDSVVVSSKTELVARRRLDPARDRVLVDHALGKRAVPNAPPPLAVLPMTFCAELASEAATRLYELESPSAVVELRDIRGHTWVSLDRGPLDLEIRAQARADAPGHVEVGIYPTGGSRPAFTVTVVVDRAGRAAASPCEPELDRSPIVRQRWRAKDLYKNLLFHGPLLHNIHHVLEVREHSLIAELIAPATDRLFADLGPGERPMLAIPASLLDGAGQLGGHHALHAPGRSYFGLFPYAIARLRLFGEPIVDHERIRIHGWFEQHGLTIRANFQLIDRRGLLRAEIEGMDQRYFDWSEALFSALYRAGDGVRFSRRLPSPFRGLTLGFAEARSFEALSKGGIFTSALAHVVLDLEERQRWQALPEDEQRDWLVERVVLKELLAAGPSVPLVMVPTLGPALRRFVLIGQTGIVGFTGPPQATAGLGLAVIERTASTDARTAALRRAGVIAFAGGGCDITEQELMLDGEQPDELRMRGRARTAFARIIDLDEVPGNLSLVLVSLQPV
jgi:malonyl CoA-acyl carrier protein transacylase